MSRKFLIGGLITASVMIAGTVLLAMSVTKIKPGYAGVIYGMDGGIKIKLLVKAGI